MPFVACRLIPLDKRPGVRPIGIGDVPRRIVAKAILFVIGEDVISAAGHLQTCAGHAAGSEAAVHAMKCSRMIIARLLSLSLMLPIVLIARLRFTTSQFFVHLFQPSCTILMVHLFVCL